MFDSKFSSFVERLKEFIGRESRSSGPPGFNELAIELFWLQYECVPAYRTYCRAIGVSPDEIREWRSIPALPISAFKELEVTSLGSETRTTVFHSSGTTGQRRSRNFHDAASLELYRTSAITWARKSLDVTARMLFLTPAVDVAPHASLVHMFDAFDNSFAGGRAQFAGIIGKEDRWEIDYEKVMAVFDQSMAANEPIGILGTAYNFVHLVEHMNEAGRTFRLPAGSWALETGGYKGRSKALSRQELYGAIEHVFGISSDRIVSEYGMCELSSQAYQISNPRTFRFPPWVQTRVISAETEEEAPLGQPGLLQVFDLANVRSVFAIQTEDMAVAHENGFELIGRATGAEQRGCSLMSAKV